MDIIQIDCKIQQHFQDEEKKLDEYKAKIAEIEALEAPTAGDPSLRERGFSPIIAAKAPLAQTLADYKKRVHDIETGNLLNFYIMESFPILEQYRKLLKTPIKINFFNKTTTGEAKDKTDLSTSKERLIHQFMQVAKKYNSLEFVSDDTLRSTQQKTDCTNCGFKKLLLVDDLYYICPECGCEKDGNINTLSYKDTSRTNILQKYAYEKRSHFKDAINQYQGKQNCKIDPKVFTDLRQQLENHHLLIGDENTPLHIRYQNVKRQHILLFLKELSYDKQYENANYIYSELTGVKCPDISHLVDQLMEDFDTLASLYTKKFKYEKNIERKSFINIQCVFFQLLLKNKYVCKKEDFNILKTADRKSFHDDILRELFLELNWTYTPFF